MRNERIKLITKSVNESAVSEIETEVWAEKKAVTYREFYAAQQVGLNPRLVFSIDLFDYNSSVQNGQEPTELKYDNRRYVIVRVYETSSVVELTVSNIT